MPSGESLNTGLWGVWGVWPSLARVSLMLAAAVLLVTAAIGSAVRGVDAAVAVDMDGEGDVEDEEEMEASMGGVCCIL